MRETTYQRDAARGADIRGDPSARYNVLSQLVAAGGALALFSGSRVDLYLFSSSCILFLQPFAISSKFIGKHLDLCGPPFELAQSMSEQGLVTLCLFRGYLSINMNLGCHLCGEGFRGKENRSSCKQNAQTRDHHFPVKAWTQPLLAVAAGRVFILKTAEQTFKKKNLSVNHTGKRGCL